MRFVRISSINLIEAESNCTRFLDGKPGSLGQFRDIHTFDAAVLGERCEIRDNWLLTRSKTSHKFLLMHDV